MGRRLATAVGITVAAILLGARADPIKPNQGDGVVFPAPGAGFENGGFFVPGSDPPSLPAPDPAWTFTLAAPASLIVVDGAFSGDQFNLTDFGVSLGNTSVPTPGDFCGTDINPCLADPNISNGTFLLGAGPHSI